MSSGDVVALMQTLIIVHILNHSGIRYVTPAQRHAEEDVAILAARHQTYLQIREYNHPCGSENARKCSPIGTITLNSERNAIVRDHLQAENKKRLVA
jgi:putative transposase